MRLSAFFLLLAAGTLLLTGAPFAKYTENLTVQIFDSYLRPVEGAQAYVDYELNSVQGYTKTKPKLSDSRGYANIVFSDYESIDSQTDYAFTLYVRYGDQLVSSSLIASDVENTTDHLENRTVTMMVESYVAFVRVFDQDGKPLQANATVGKVTKQTDPSGRTFFALSPGNYTLKVERSDLVRNIPLAIGNATGDKSFDVLLSYYKLDIRVQDDKRNPLPAQVEVNGISANTDSDGMAHFENITTSTPQVIVMYGQKIKRLQPNLQAGPSLEVTFDISRPIINDQVSTLSPSGVGTIRFFVEDLGPEASGIDTVSVSYEVSGVQNTLSVYTIGYNSFEAKIPAQPADTLVKYTITVSDKEGNAAVGSGNYVVGGSQASQGNASAPGTPVPASSSIPNEAIFVGIAALAVLAFAAIYYFNRRKASEISPPPFAPPPLPRP